MIQRQPHPHQLRQMSRHHLPHDPAAVDFDGAFTDAQIKPDGFVRLTVRGAAEHLGFAFGKPCHPIPQGRILRVLDGNEWSHDSVPLPV